ncbi:MAG: ComEA family DNA-binding protein [Syntrophales bacterium]
MRVREGQHLGALTILIASLAFYGGALLRGQQPTTELSMRWGNQGPDTIAAEVTGSRDAEGIYFFPKGTGIADILKAIYGEGAIDAEDGASTDGSAIAISSAGGARSVKDMPAGRRLALGLPIDLNRASAEDLSLIPGIGERMAIEIVQRRQAMGRFAALSDLTTIPGIKERKLSGVRRYLTVGTTF